MDEIKSPGVDFVLVMSLIFLGLAQSSDAQIAFNSTVPQDVPYCAEEEVRTMFTVRCQYSGNNDIAPNWQVSGLATMMDQTIASSMSTGPFITQGGGAESTLTVNSSEVTNRTCFQCLFTTGSGPVTSRQGCLTPVDTPETPSIVIITTPNNISWSPSATGLNHRIIVCFPGTSNCPITPSCTGCNFAVITGIAMTDTYNISVCSSNVVNGESCRSESCISTSAELNATTTMSTFIASTTTVLSTMVSSPATAPTTPTASIIADPNIGAIAGGSVAGVLIILIAVVITIIVVVIVVKHKQKNKPDGVKLTKQPGEEMATLHEDATYASPGEKNAATEGADGVYSYAATTTVVGAKMDPKQKAGKKAGDEKKDAQPDKPKRGNYKQPPPADVPHKQGPAGELYAMPEKKPQTVGHVQGPQGDFYAVSAKPSKGAYGAEGPQ